MRVYIKVQLMFWAADCLLPANFPLLRTLYQYTYEMLTHQPGQTLLSNPLGYYLEKVYKEFFLHLSMDESSLTCCWSFSPLGHPFLRQKWQNRVLKA